MAQIFKTPRPRYMDQNATPTAKRKKSDSEESCSSASESSETPNKLTLVAMYDDLMRSIEQQRNEYIENVFLDFVEQTQDTLRKMQELVNENRRIQELLDQKTLLCSDYEKQINTSRRLLDKERQNTRMAQNEQMLLEEKLAQIQDLLFGDKSTKLSDDTREKLELINGFSRRRDGEQAKYRNLSAIQEINSTGSLLSEASYSKSEDDLDESYVPRKDWKTMRPSLGAVPEPVHKKCRSSTHKVVEINQTETVRATTTLTVGKEGPITATSVIESIPKGCTSEQIYLPSAPPASLYSESPISSPRKGYSKGRPHNLQQKMLVIPEVCLPCGKKIGFGKNYLKCKSCRCISHVECKDLLPMPCTPITPSQNNGSGLIEEYAPSTPPMIPALIMQCVNELESRGLKDIGLYRICAAESEVRMLKEKFLEGKRIPALNKIEDVHVLCGTIKNFLKSLKEPLIVRKLRTDLLNVCSLQGQEALSVFHQLINKLPRPNRDTLSFIILHLQRVVKERANKMTVQSLSIIFGPTIVGYEEADPDSLLRQTEESVQIIERFIELPTEFWERFLEVGEPLQTVKLQQTPSTDSLLRGTASRYIATTPSSSTSGLYKRKKVFTMSPFK